MESTDITEMLHDIVVETWKVCRQCQLLATEDPKRHSLQQCCLVVECKGGSVKCIARVRSVGGGRIDCSEKPPARVRSRGWRSVAAGNIVSSSRDDDSFPNQICSSGTAPAGVASGCYVTIL